MNIPQITTPRIITSHTPTILLMLPDNNQQSAVVTFTVMIPSPPPPHEHQQLPGRCDRRPTLRRGRTKPVPAIIIITDTIQLFTMKMMMILVAITTISPCSSMLFHHPSPQPQQQQQRYSTAIQSPNIATIRQNRYPNRNDENYQHDDADNDDIDTTISTTTSLSITIPPYLPAVVTTTDSTLSSDQQPFTYPSVLHEIHVTNILSPVEVQHCRSLAQQHAQQTKCWETPDTLRHASYATCDFPVDACPSLQQYWNDALSGDARIQRALSTMFRIPPHQMYFLDLFCVRYQAATTTTTDNDTSSSTTTTTTMDRLGSHRDGSLLSFTITLTEPDQDFTGGGTFFDALVNVTQVVMDTETFRDPDKQREAAQIFNTRDGVVRPLNPGDGVFHCGKLLHGGHAITSGTRIVLVGFVDVIHGDDDNDDDDDDTFVVRPGRLHAACRDWGRLDVATFRYQRQQQHQQQQRIQSLKYRRSERSKKWIPPNNCFRNIYPTIRYNRAGWDMPYQRQRRLEIEDQLLRSVLRSDEERAIRTMVDVDNDHDDDDDTSIARRNRPLDGRINDDITILE